MTRRSTSADFVTAFATGWPENQPKIMVLSLTTQKGVQDFALNKGTGEPNRESDLFNPSIPGSVEIRMAALAPLLASSHS
jgi:hypothetical protein